ncbi:MAG: hypothetical protein R2932_43885 [Caldilineaceae bacterium]
MIDTFINETKWATAAHQLHRTEMYRRIWLVLLLGGSALTAIAMSAIGPTPLPLGGILFVATLAIIFYQPRVGLYFVLFFSLVGDQVLMQPYPFVKNLSSRESLLYIHDALIFSPLELYLVITLVAWIGKGLFGRTFRLHFGVMTWPVGFFSLFLITGLLWGLSTGGNTNVALWESRSIFYLPLIMLLTVNLIEKREHVSQIIWVIMTAVFVEGIIGVIVFFTRHHGSLAGVEAINRTCGGHS